MENNLNFAALEKNLIALVQEFQVKLGDSRDAIGLYYPLESLNRLLDAELDATEMEAALREFSGFALAALGEVTATDEGGMFCLRVPAEGVALVRANGPDTGFLKDFIGKITQHGLDIDDLLAVFRKYSENVVCERIGGEFDYLVYFADGRPDDFRYCIKFEGPHAIYHRFTPKDYDAMGFERA